MEKEDDLIERLCAFLEESPTGRVLDHGRHPLHRGDMERPDARARLTGPCGDTDEMFLRVCSDRVQEVRFLTDGCFFTTAACDATALLARGKTIDECLTLDEQAILDYLEDMPEDHTHCAILALLTLREAIHQYFDRQRTGTRP